MFGLVVPGREVEINFLQTEDLRWIVDVPQPGDIHELCLFLQRPIGAPIGVYYSFPPFSAWEFLGVLTDARPSSFFSTGWSLLPETQSQCTVRFLLAVENEAELLRKLETANPVDFKKEYGRRVAMNLANYIESFNDGGSSALAAQPLAVLEQWLKRFEEKYKLDPNFVMRG
eukprot:Lankesteria_metandrocarpae@DN5532_c0_g1_i1.p1